MANYSWFRAYNGITSDPKWPLLAKRSGQAIGTVVAIWLAILDYVSQQEDRGNLEGFCCEEVDALFGYEEGTTQRVLTAMEDRGMIVDGVVVSWGKRQVSRTSSGATAAMTGAERSRRYRERLREQRDASVTTRDASVTTRDASVTTDKIREDKNREDKIRTNTPPSPPTGGTRAGARAYARVCAGAREEGVLPEDELVDSSSNQAEPPAWLDDVPLPTSEDVQPSEEPVPVEQNSVTPAEQPVETQSKPEPDCVTKPKRRRQVKDTDETPLRPEDWERWYAAYPRHEGKQQGIRAWNKAVQADKLPPVENLLSTLEWQSIAHSWTPKSPYVPLPASYLNGRRWQDERPPADYDMNQRTTPGPRPQYGRKPTYQETYENNLAVTRQVLDEMSGKIRGFAPRDMTGIDPRGLEEALNSGFKFAPALGQQTKQLTQ